MKPKGHLDQVPGALEWHWDGPDEVVWTVGVFDENLVEVFRGSASATRIALPAALQGRLARGGTFYWQVGVAPAGRPRCSPVLISLDRGAALDASAAAPLGR